MKQIFSACAGAVLMVTPPGQASESTNTIKLSAEYINGLANIMLTNHPALRAAASRVRAAGHATSAVRTWEDPEVMLGGQFAEEEMRADEGELPLRRARPHHPHHRLVQGGDGREGPVPEGGVGDPGCVLEDVAHRPHEGRQRQRI